MDEETIKRCLTSSGVFTGNLLGIVGVPEFRPTHKEVRDGYVFNTNRNVGEHWFAMINARGTWYLFDCSNITPNDDHTMIINRLKCNVDMQTGQLQALNSMTCGEHSITFLCLFMKLIDDGETLDGVDYCETLTKSCEGFGESPDQYVTDFIYSSGRFPHAKKPSLASVDAWSDELR